MSDSLFHSDLFQTFIICFSCLLCHIHTHSSKWWHLSICLSVCLGSKMLQCTCLLWLKTIVIPEVSWDATHKIFSEVGIGKKKTSWLCVFWVFLCISAVLTLLKLAHAAIQWAVQSRTVLYIGSTLKVFLQSNWISATVDLYHQHWLYVLFIPNWTFHCSFFLQFITKLSVTSLQLQLIIMADTSRTVTKNTCCQFTPLCDKA